MSSQKGEVEMSNESVVRINHYNIPQPVVQSLMVWFPILLVILAGALSWGFVQRSQLNKLRGRLYANEEEYTANKNKYEETIKRLEYDIRMLKPLEGKLKSAQKELEIANEDIEKYKQYKNDCDELTSTTNRMSIEISELVARLNRKSSYNNQNTSSNVVAHHSPKCYYCNGTGYGRVKRTCVQCNGRGKVNRRETIVTGTTTFHGYAKTITKDISAPCPGCNGKGYWFDDNGICPRCKGRGE